MKVLLDTHIIIWAITDSEELPSEARKIISDDNNTLYCSVASIWEVAIKNNLFTKDMPITEEEFVSECKNMGLFRVDIKDSHIFTIKELKQANPPAHKDPFDRMMIAQAKNEGMKFLTHDGLLEVYGEDCVIIAK